MVATTNLYFQTSATLLGYWQTTALAYAQTLPVPWQNNNMFLGVNPSGLDLTYVTNGMMAIAAGQAGRPIPATLFQQAITGNSRGLTDGAIFCNCIGQLLTPNLVPAPTVPFSIIDHNSCHHLSAPLAAYAFRRAGVPANGIRIVFNIDDHADFGVAAINPNTMSLGCGQWGLWTVSSVVGLYPLPVADLYVHLGVPQQVSPNRGVGWRGAVGNAFGAPTGLLQWMNLGPPPVNPLTLFGFLDQRFNLNGNWNTVYAYVSVDRDFMIGSYTPYGDGTYTQANGQALVANLLLQLRAWQTHLVGFDVTGLPTQDGWTNVNPPPANPALLNQAAQDVGAFYQAVLAY